MLLMSISITIKDNFNVINTNIHFAGFECAQWESVVLPGGIILGNIILLFILLFLVIVCLQSHSNFQCLTQGSQGQLRMMLG